MVVSTAIPGTPHPPHLSLTRCYPARLCAPQHLRLNDPDTSRNPLVNFVSALDRYPNQQDALLRLQQLSAVFRPVMKRHGLTINSLEEYEPNPEFAGRNWNAGETIEMVLRTHSGAFLPFGLVCGVFAHELAHNVHMNHVPSKHGALTRQLSDECRELRRKGYHGDGFWSGGQRLGDTAWVRGEGEVTSESVPQSLCGGAWRKGSRKRTKRKRQSGGEPRKRRAKGVPSLRTGAQTAANTERAAGRRRADMALPGQGSRVDGQNHLPTASAKSDTYKSDPNSTFRKRANASSARDVRAAAAMRRIAALQQQQQQPKLDEKDALPADESKKCGTPAATALPGHTLSNQNDQPADAGDDSVTESESETDDDDECELYESSDEDSAAAAAAASAPCGSAATAGPTAVTGAESGPAATPAPAPAHNKSHTETAEQRKRRTARFQRAQQGEARAASPSAAAAGRGKAPATPGSAPAGGEEWSTLLRDSQREQRLRAFDRPRGATAQAGSGSAEGCKKEEGRVGPGTKGNIEVNDSDDDDDVIFVEIKKAS